MKAEELLNSLGVKGKKDKKDLLTILEQMEEEGLIIKTKKKKYGVPERMNLVVGRLQSNKKGFGFIISDVGIVGSDVYVSSEDLNGAMHNDRVIARMTKRSEEGLRNEGEIIRIIKRGNEKIVGTFESSRNFGFVVPDDQKISQDIFIPRSETMGAREGYKVVVEITQYPESRRNPEGRIIEILGHMDDVGIDILSIIRKHDLPQEFPPEVSNQAKNIPDTIRKEDIKGRKDLRDRKIFTIDGEDAKDLDDAVSIEKLSNGNYLLAVHIADVSYYVFENTPIDKEAFERGNSIYLVDRVIPMLPQKLSNGICSLNPKVDRLAFSCFMEINDKGKVVKHELVKTIINSKERMTYSNVTKILEEENKELIDRYNQIHEDLILMKELALILRKDRRLKRGTIDFDFDEAKIILDNEGKPIDIQLYKRGIADKIIEEFMLVCNETVAEQMYWASLPFIYRVHEEPDLGKLMEFNNFIHNFGYHLKMGDEIRPKELQNLLNRIKGRPEEIVIGRLTLRTMKQAKYSHLNIGHFGLAAKYYTHFTSPIRRYSDLTIHRIISEMLYGKISEEEIKKLNKKTPVVALQVSERERIAEEAERETDDLKKAEFMQKKIGDKFKGIISGVTSFGMFVELENTIEGLVRVSSMDDDYYQYDEKNHRFIGERTKKTYRLGEEVRVQVIKVDVTQKQIDFILIQE